MSESLYIQEELYVLLGVLIIVKAIFDLNSIPNSSFCERPYISRYCNFLCKSLSLLFRVSSYQKNTKEDSSSTESSSLSSMMYQNTILRDL